MNDILPQAELEDALLEKQSIRREVLSEVSSLFDDAGFVKKEKQNTIFFQTSTKRTKALFSIDNTTYNYECYITTGGDNSSSYSAKGGIDDLADAAIKFVEQYADFTDGVDFYRRRR